jgi:hypothetical protein
MRRKTEILPDIEKQSVTLKAAQFRRSATDRFWIRGRVENTTLSIKSRKSTLDRQEAGKYDALVEGHREGKVAGLIFQRYSKVNYADCQPPETEGFAPIEAVVELRG